MLPARAGTTFLQKCDANHEFKHEKHKRGSLKLAFLMHIRNKFLGGYFFCFLLGTGYCFCKVIKSAPWSVLSGRAECAGALGGDMRGVCDLQIWDWRFWFWLSIRHAGSCLRHGRRIQLKALWGGHTAAHQFMLCIKFPIGERRHAIWNRRLHEDEITTACTAKMVPKWYWFASFPPRAASIFSQNEARCDAKKWKCHHRAMR